MSVNIAFKINDQLVKAKLVAAAPAILAQNAVMAKAMLDEVKTAVVGATPLGPGHFGYHGRDTVKVEVTSSGVRTTAKLKAAMQLYWREYGTGIRFRGRGKRTALRQSVRVMTGSATGGEPALMVANRALNFTKRFIKFYYGGMANWWNT